MSPGRLIRVTFLDVDGRSEKLQAVVARSEPDTLFVRPEEAPATLLPIPYASIRTLEVDAGRDHSSGALIGAVLGFGVVFVAFMSRNADTADRLDRVTNDQGDEVLLGPALAIGALAGAPLGAVIGRSAFAPQRWQTIPLAGVQASRLHITPILHAQPSDRPRLGVHLSLDL